MEVPIIAGAAVALGLLASHAFHSYLGVRERERLSSTAEAKIAEQFRAVDAKLNKHENALANIPRR